MSDLRDRLQEAVNQDGRSLNQIERDAGLGKGTLIKFLNGSGGESLRVPVLQALAGQLGTTVGALLGEAAPDGEAGDQGAAGVIGIPLQDLRVSGLNPRHRFEAEPIETLAESIARHGVLQNLVVRPHPEARGKYLIVSGARRFLACEELERDGAWPPAALPDGLLPCRVLLPLDAAGAEGAEAADQEHVILALIENMEREALTPIEEARAFETLQHNGWSSDAIAERIHRTQRFVQQRLALMRLIPAVRDILEEEGITVSQARALARANPEEQPELLRLIQSGALTTEAAIDEAAKAQARRRQIAAGSGPASLAAGGLDAVASHDGSAAERRREAFDPATAPLPPKLSEIQREAVPHDFLNVPWCTINEDLAVDFDLELMKHLPPVAYQADVATIWAKTGNARLTLVAHGELRPKAELPNPGWGIAIFVDAEGEASGAIQIGRSEALREQVEAFIREGLDQGFRSDAAPAEEEEDGARAIGDPSAPVPPIYAHVDCVTFKPDFIAVLEKELPRWLPAEAADGASLNLRIEGKAESVSLYGKGGKGWHVYCWQDATGCGWMGSCAPSGKVETFLRAGLRKGFLVETETQTRARQAAEQAEARAQRQARYRLILDRLGTLRAEELDAETQRELAQLAIDLALRNAEIAAAEGWQENDAACAAFDDHVGTLTDRVCAIGGVAMPDEDAADEPAEQEGAAA